MFHKAMSQEGLQPVGPDFDPEEMTHRSVVGFVGFLSIFIDDYGVSSLPERLGLNSIKYRVLQSVAPKVFFQFLRNGLEF